MSDKTEIIGGDIEHHSVKKSVGNYKNCHKLCQDIPECKAWTSVESSCYIKGINTNPVPTAAVVSGLKECNASGKQKQNATS